MAEKLPMLAQRLKIVLRQYNPAIRVKTMRALSDTFCRRCGKEHGCDCPKPGRPKKVKNVEAAATK